MAVCRLEKFDPKVYYQVAEDFNYEDLHGEYLTYVKPSLKGGYLISTYYKKKYQANITLPISDEYGSYDPASKKPQIDPCRKQKYFIKYMKNICKEKLNLASYREAFLFDFGKHTSLAIYIKENNQQCFLFADSSGVLQNGQIRESTNDFYRCLKKETGSEIFVIADARQTDLYSCHIVCDQSSMI